MFVKVFSRGSASGSSEWGPVDYVLSSKNHRHEKRASEPKLLRGDPELTKSVIDGVPYVQRYTAGVLSFAQEETPLLTGPLKTALMDGFEQMVAPGVPKDRLCWLWVEHAEHSRFELHWVVANVDLETGKRFAPYFDRADRPRFAAWQSYQNLQHGLADPQEPDRRRAIAPASRFLSPEAKGNAAQLNEALEQLCAQGELRNRDDIVRFLTERVGVKVPRHGKDYITV